MTTEERAKIAQEIESLDGMTTAELREKWVEVWKEPSRSNNRVFLRKRIAWKIQANACGGLSQRALERAAQLADETLLKVRGAAPPGAPVAAAVHRRVQRKDSRLPMPGSVIAREYAGRKIVVSVLDRGFEFEGRTYRSLSAVATAVTGAHWNGYAFFGLADGKAME